MLIEWNKLCFRQKDNNLSHLYAMFSVDWNRNSDTPTGVVSYEGAVSLQKLKAGYPTTYVLRKGSYIPGTRAVLQADNFGIQFKDLYKHLNHLVAYITAGPPNPQMVDNFVNPYSTEKSASKTLPAQNTSCANKAEPTSQSMHFTWLSRLKKLFTSWL